MTDKEKLAKVIAEIERLYNQSLADENRQAELGLKSAACTSYGKSKVCKEFLSFIDSMQEEPTTSVWHDTRSEEPIVGCNIVMLYYNHIYSGEYLGERFFGREKFTLMSDSKWAYFDDLLKL